MANPYQVLGVHPDADEDVIEAAYRALSKKHHPDSGGSVEEFKRIRAAYDEICSEDSDSVDEQNYVEDFNLFQYPVDTNTIKGKWGETLRIEGDELTVTLLGLYKTDVSELAYESPNNSQRYIIILNAENTSENLQKWKPLDNLKVIGSDDFTYEIPGRGQFDRVTNDLPPRMTITSVELEPGTKTNSITIAKGMPDDVYPSKIIYSHHSFAGNRTDGLVQGKNRFEFDLETVDWSQLKPLEA